MFRWIAAALMIACAAPAMAQTYPNRPVRVIVAAGPGSVSDVIARTVAPDLGTALGGSVIIENRTGASGFLAAETSARAAPDGHTIFLSTAGIMTINPHLHARLPYDPVRGFIPVALLASMPNVLVVNPAALPVRSPADLVDRARREPGRLTYGTFGSGSTPHLTALLFAGARDIALEQVPYRSSPLALNDLLGGNLSLMFDTVGSVLPLVQAGNLRALAVTTRVRSAVLPDVPTMEEAGFPGFEVMPWYGFHLPTGTDPAIVARLLAETTRVLASPAIVERFAALGLDVGALTGERFAAFETAERERWGRVIGTAGLRPN